MKKFLFAFISMLSISMLTETVNAQNYALPFKTDDLKPYERMYTGNHAAGIQGEGEDLGMLRYVSDNKWSSNKEGTDGTKNSDKVIYGKPVYAMADGKIIGCWCNAPENPRPKLKGDSEEDRPWLHDKFKSKEMPGGGNLLWVQHADGTRMLYAHLIPGTMPGNLCANKNALFPKPLGDKESENMYVMLPADKQVDIKKGQFLGKAGNAGSSTGPHTHIHLEKNGQAAIIKFEAGVYKPYSDNGTDIQGGWSSFATKEIPDGEVLIRPPRDNNYRMIDFEFYSYNGKNMYVGIFEPGTYGPSALFKNNWNDFLAGWQANEKKGYRMVDFEHFEANGNSMYAGIFEPGSYTPMALFKDNWNDFLSGWQEIEKKNYRMLDYERFTVNGKVMYAGIFKPGTYGPAALFKNNWNDFLTGWQDIEKKGQRMIDFEEYPSGNGIMYAGIFKPATYSPTALLKNDWDDFLQGWKNIESQGKRMIDFEFFIANGKPTYAGIFAPGNYTPAAIFSTTWDNFLERWQNLE